MEQPTTFYHFPPLLSKKSFNIVEEIAFAVGNRLGKSKITGRKIRLYIIDYQIIKLSKLNNYFNIKFKVER